jgi:hypothetical protein
MIPVNFSEVRAFPSRKGRPVSSHNVRQDHTVHQAHNACRSSRKSLNSAANGARPPE